MSLARQGGEDLSVQAFIAQLVVEAFNTVVFPACWGLDISGSDRLTREPVLNGLGNKLWSIIAAQVLGRAITLDCCLQHRDRINGPDRVANVNGEALLSVFVDQGQNAQRTALFGLVVRQIPTPNLVPMLSSRT